MVFVILSQQSEHECVNFHKLQYLDNGSLLGSVKAFGSVDYSILWNKHGIKSVTLHLVESYLFGQEQCVVESKHNSEKSMSQFSSIIKGCPPGFHIRTLSIHLIYWFSMLMILAHV